MDSPSHTVLVVDDDAAIRFLCRVNLELDGWAVQEAEAIGFLRGKSAAFIKQSIENPDAYIAPGFMKGIMPPNYRDTLSPAEIDALVAYLSKVTKK